MTPKPFKKTAKSDIFNTDELKSWLQSLPQDRQTSIGYPVMVTNYWNEHLSRKYLSLTDYIQRVEKDQRSPRNIVRIGWALELKAFLTAYVSPTTG